MVLVSFQRPIYRLFLQPQIICETYLPLTKMSDGRLRHLASRSQLIVAHRMQLFEFQFVRVYVAMHLVLSTND